MEFEAFQKIPRLSRECVVTEKIDGTNGQICIDESGVVMVGSRNQWITDKTDNFGFYKWVMEHRDELIAELGIGRHYGEWWGSGIQRGYGLSKGEKRFSLFNTHRWKAEALKVCSVVPVLHEGDFDMLIINHCLNYLLTDGSIAAPGFMKPEGVVVYHKAANCLFKKTIEKDEEPKGKAA
jgi:hypothetical protein